MNQTFDHYAIFEKELHRRRNTPKKLNVYTILQKITISEAIEKIQSKEIKSDRFARVMKLGECCVTCGLKRAYVALGKDKGNSLHWDLYAEDGTIMTIDHIIPKSKGGKDVPSNYQLMCAPCNFDKDSYIDINQVNSIVEEILSTAYDNNVNSEHLISHYLKEVHFRKDSFKYNENLKANAFYLHLRVDEARGIRKLNPYFIRLFNEFLKRLESGLTGLIDYEIGKVYIIKT